jgi:hypothetical protein
MSLLLAGLLALAIIGTLATSAQAQSSNSTPGGFSSSQANPNTGVTTSTTISGTAYGGETTSYQGLACQYTVEDPSLLPGRLSNPQYQVDSGSATGFTLTQTQTGVEHVGGGCGAGSGTYQNYEYSFSFSVSATGLSPGGHTVTITATDSATGQTVSTSATFTVASSSCSPNCDPQVFVHGPGLPGFHHRNHPGKQLHPNDQRRLRLNQQYLSCVAHRNICPGSHSSADGRPHPRPQSGSI